MKSHKISSAKIPGGCILLPRLLIQEFMDKPPLYLKLFLWMFEQARFKDGEKLKRGQLFTSVPLIQKAMAYKSGYRTNKPSQDQIREILKHLRSRAMVTTRKTQNGQIITISNYDFYQSFQNYGPRNQSHNQSRNLYKERNGLTNDYRRRAWQKRQNDEPPRYRDGLEVLKEKGLPIN